MSGGLGISINQSYWGVQGFEVTTTNSGFLPNQKCFDIYPTNPSQSVHHIIFANDIANGCQGGGYGGNYNYPAGTDYIAVLGSIAYNTAQSSAECFSGISFYAPLMTDSLSGTHIYVAGNFSYGNLDPNPCAGAKPTDGEGLIFDTFSSNNYSAQAVSENNMFLANGGRGFEVYLNRSSSSAPVYSIHNTIWGNNRDATQACYGEVNISFSYTASSSYDLVVPSTTPGCITSPLYGVVALYTNSTSLVYNDWIYSAAGNNVNIAASPGFSISPENTTGANPVFANPVIPSAPNCGSATNVPNCMATIIADFTPATTLAKEYGYQTPGSASIVDPFYPQWLCTVSLPTGLVTPGCTTAPGKSGE